MLINKEIQSSYLEQIESASESQISELDKEIDRLRLWGERWSADVMVPEYETIKVLRFFKIDENFVEIQVNEVTMNLEAKNKKILGPLDEQIVKSLRNIKKIGFERPLAVICMQMFNYIHSEKIENLYNDKLTEWCGVLLVWKRILSTARVSIRILYPEKYGKRTIYHDDGSVSVIDGDKQWKKILIDRKVIPNRK